MEAEAGAELRQRFGVLRKLGEDLHLDGTEQGFGSPEAEAYLHDVVGPWIVHGWIILMLNLFWGREARMGSG